MTPSSVQCFLCGTPSPNAPTFSHYTVHCESCGTYEINERTLPAIQKLHPRKKAFISTAIRRSKIYGRPVPILVNEITAEAIDAVGETGRLVSIPDLVPQDFPDISTRLDLILLNLAELSINPGFEINVTTKDSPLFYAENYEAMVYSIRQLKKAGFIEQKDESIPGKLILTIAGWNRIYELKRGGLTPDHRQAFVAMWFHEDMAGAFEKGIKPAVEAAGFQPYMVGVRPSNNQITDDLITQIRASRFIVADVTGERPSVYYEAGFMHGLGRPVIFTVRESHRKNLHFDTRQYPHIIWKDFEDLQKQLYNRIKATIPE